MEFSNLIHEAALLKRRSGPGIIAADNSLLKFHCINNISVLKSSPLHSSRNTWGEPNTRRRSFPSELRQLYGGRRQKYSDQPSNIGSWQALGKW